MPKESRNIFFTQNEVKIALARFSARKGLEFVADNITEFDLKTDGVMSIVLKVFDSKTSKTGTVKYNQQEVAAAMMAYCMFLKIPLPKAGQKSIQAKNGELFLNIKLQS